MADDREHAPQHRRFEREPRADGAESLSRREREVLQLIAEGLEIAGIASSLGLSPDTVRSHLRSARARLRARTRAHAVAIALMSGQLEPVQSPPATPSRARANAGVAGAARPR